MLLCNHSSRGNGGFPLIGDANAAEMTTIPCLDTTAGCGSSF
jgi:hypothetical protein